MTDYWRPETLDDLRSFIDNGVARESRRIEFKREIPNTRSGNRTLARQLAAFAIEGGSIVIGVAEETDNQFTVAPVPFAGLRERVEQIAQSVVEPPLWVESRVLADNDGENGVLWIDVPQSPDAPHQVDGTYYERGDAQVRPMSDTAVERLMRTRSSSLNGIIARVREGRGESPIPHGIGHTYIVAQPIGAAHEALYVAAGRQPGWQALARELQGALPVGKANLSRLKALREPSSSWGTTATPEHAVDPRAYLRLALEDVGALSSRTYSQARNSERLQPGLAIAACLDAVAVMRLVEAKIGRRMWDLAIGITKTKDREARALSNQAFDPDVSFPADNYERALRTPSIRLEEDPWGIARDLTQRFVEDCGLDFDGEARVLGYEP